MSQVDALGRTTTWSIDGNGRITARQIQDASRETNRYDAEGNRVDHLCGNALVDRRHR